MASSTRLRSLGLILCAVCAVVAVFGFQAGGNDNDPLAFKDGGDPFSPGEYHSASANFLAQQIEEGRRTFRFDTFGDEAFWGGTLRLHEAIAGANLGGVGPGVGPGTALAVGLKVDATAAPRSLLRRALAHPDDPAITVELLRENAVVGVKGFFTGRKLTGLGLQCAFCHSTVDNSVAPGVGRRLDGWANRDLNVGLIISLAPNLQPFSTLLSVPVDTVKAVLNSWGPGKFDAELLLDGKARRPDGGSAATLIPPAFGLAGVNLHTWTGWGSVTHWNGFVANLEMMGKGTFYDPRLNDAAKFPIAAANGFGNVRNNPDLITGKLAALHLYQLSLPAPSPPRRSIDAAAVARGRALFRGDEAKCATCHVPPLFTEPGWNMHTPEEMGIDPFQADRSPDGHYRTAPLKGLWTHTTGGFYHDGRFATLDQVLDHYEDLLDTDFDTGERRDLIAYLMSLGDTPNHQFRYDGNEGPSDEAEAAVSPNGLQAIRPNPSADETEITFTLAKSGAVELGVFDLQGRQVADLSRGRTFEAGEHRVVWQPSRGSSPVAPGVYFVRMRADGAAWSERLVRIP